MHDQHSTGALTLLDFPILLSSDHDLLLNVNYWSNPHQEVVPDRLAYFRQIYEVRGFLVRIIELVIESSRRNTTTANNSAWRKRFYWQNINPISATVATVTLWRDLFDSGLQYHTIYMTRSSISTTHLQ